MTKAATRAAAATPPRPPPRHRRVEDGFRWWWRRGRRRAPSVLPQAQDLPVLGAERAEDRLQGHEAPVPLRLGARQDRAVPDHGGFGEEAARARDRDQAGPLPRAFAV